MPASAAVPETSTGAATTIRALSTPAVARVEEYIKDMDQLMFCVVTEMPVPSPVSVTRAGKQTRADLVCRNDAAQQRLFVVDGDFNQLILGRSRAQQVHDLFKLFAVQIVAVADEAFRGCRVRDVGFVGKRSRRNQQHQECQQQRGSFFL